MKLDEYYLVGSRYVIDFMFVLDTPVFSRNKSLTTVEKYCADYSMVNCNYSYWRMGDRFYSFAEIKDLLYNSPDTVNFGNEVEMIDISKDR